MKLSKLYSNVPEKFEPIEFGPGLNVVLAEIRLPENKNRDTHNLGKTTLGRLLDFGFLLGRSPDFFLFKHADIFQQFVFFLEIELNNSTYVTIRRSVAEHSKISFKKHQTNFQDFSDISIQDFDHQDIPFERARDLLDGLLDWRALSPFPYRKVLGYLLRTQDDYADVFHLHKFASGHASWKPFLAHILGFNSGIISEKYEKEDAVEKKKATELAIKNELGGSVEDISKVEGLLLLHQKDAEKKQRLLDAFDFRPHDKARTKDLVDEIDDRIADLNSERYSKNFARKKVKESLQENQILFDPEEAEKLFGEAGVLFEGQIRHDFEQLIAFNRAISDERRGYLQEELVELEEQIRAISSELTKLGKKRSEMLSFLSSTDIFAKYKLVSNELVTLRADITNLERRKEFLHKLQSLRGEIRAMVEEVAHLQARIENDVEEQNADNESFFSTIRLYFNEIVEDVIDRKALLSVSTNSQGNLEFKAEILDEAGNATSADLGHTYRKLLCVAFDLAVLRAHIDDHYPRFAFHDGVFESLDDRKKENLLQIIRQYMDLGLQLVITTIDSDLPNSIQFPSEEVVVTLHDEGERGRIFKMSSW